MVLSVSFFNVHSTQTQLRLSHRHGLTGSRPPGNSSLFFFLFLLSSDLFPFFLHQLTDLTPVLPFFLSLIFCSLQLLIQLAICLFLSLYLFYCFSSQYTVHSTLHISITNWQFVFFFFFIYFTVSVHSTYQSLIHLIYLIILVH
jgi:hypothetical protein